MNEQLPTEVPSTHVGAVEVVSDLHGGFARGGDTVDVFWFQTAICHRIERRVGVQLDLRHVGNDAEFRGLRGTDDGDCVVWHRFSLSPGGRRAV